MEHANHFTILANLDAQKHVGICARGIIHLTWGMATFRFRPQDFACLAHTLAENAENPGSIAGSPQIRSFAKEDGEVMLRILDYGLFLSNANFLMLIDMIVTAAERIKKIPLQRPAASTRSVLTQTGSRVFFSKN